MKKRYRRRLWAALLALVLLLVGVSSAFRAGVHLGYRWGSIPAQDGEEVAPQGPGSRWGPPIHGGPWQMYGGYWGRPTRGGVLGRFLSLLLVLLGAGALLKVLRYKAWHLHMHRAHGPLAHGSSGHGPWRHGSWGGRHPCGCGSDQSADSDAPPADEQVAKVQPEPDAS